VVSDRHAKRFPARTRPAKRHFFLIQRARRYRQPITVNGVTGSLCRRRAPPPRIRTPLMPTALGPKAETRSRREAGPGRLPPKRTVVISPRTAAIRVRGGSISERPRILCRVCLIGSRGLLGANFRPAGELISTTCWTRQPLMGSGGGNGSTAWPAGPYSALGILQSRGSRSRLQRREQAVLRGELAKKTDGDYEVRRRRDDRPWCCSATGVPVQKPACEIAMARDVAEPLPRAGVARFTETRCSPPKGNGAGIFVLRADSACSPFQKRSPASFWIIRRQSQACSLRLR